MSLSLHHGWPARYAIFPRAEAIALNSRFVAYIIVIAPCLEGHYDADARSHIQIGTLPDQMLTANFPITRCVGAASH